MLRNNWEKYFLKKNSIDWLIFCQLVEKRKNTSGDFLKM